MELAIITSKGSHATIYAHEAQSDPVPDCADHKYFGLHLTPNPRELPSRLLLGAFSSLLATDTSVLCKYWCSCQFHCSGKTSAGFLEFYQASYKALAIKPTSNVHAWQKAWKHLGPALSHCGKCRDPCWLPSQWAGARLPLNWLCTSQSKDKQSFKWLGFKKKNSASFLRIWTSIYKLH